MALRRLEGTEGSNFSIRNVVNKRGLQNVGRLDVTMKDLHVLKQNAGLMVSLLGRLGCLVV